LAQPPEMIKLSEIFDVLEGPVITVECVMNESSCARAADCIAKPIWSHVHWAVTNILRSTTLQDTLDKAKKGQQMDYQI
jgi:Rrf2 family cysteine metabolism transcriptional repressor